MVDLSGELWFTALVKTRDAIAFFGSATKLAEALGITKQAVSKWGERVPEPRDYQIEVISRGAVKARDEAAA